MDAATLLAAATEAENHGHSETLFVVMGIVLALFAMSFVTARAARSRAKAMRRTK